MKLAGFHHLLLIAFVPLMALCFPSSALSQAAPLAPPQLDQLVARIDLPYYDPLAVFAPPRPGIGGAIRFGLAVTIGAILGGWGWWLGSGFAWPSHAILIDRRPWGRVWTNRFGYVHPYGHPWARPAGPRVEVHRSRR